MTDTENTSTALVTGPGYDVRALLIVKKCENTFTKIAYSYTS